ncbi:MAG TPA: hypothetical protein VKM35_12155 [Arenimonas sp.]|uniref:hypothetical protein n=1 Tax=Arenimonas sp. TaxID=1872635 RepID=UPI002BB5397C|nr:hypothetical protein [Arenimonas sp.]HMB57944.1 hypothetical protein [Arenimonas sp.]
MESQEILDRMLLGAMLDSFRVCSSMLEIRFLRIPVVPEIPGEVWLTATCVLLVKTSHGELIVSEPLDSFVEERRAAILGLYDLIGESVVGINIAENNQLNCQIGSTQLVFSPDLSVEDDAWEMESKQSENEQCWYFGCFGDGELVCRLPDESWKRLAVPRSSR